MLIRALQAAAGNFGVAGYNIEDSLRFNDNDSAYLSRTPSVSGDRKTWTWSAWVKLGNLSIFRTLLAARLGTSDADSFQIYLVPGDQINISGATYGLTGDPLLRDPSGWYHIVVAFDTTQATSANRIKAYINGTQITLVGTSPPLNLNGAINNTQRHDLGFRPTNNDRPFDGYMAEVNFIDGQALTADDFGQIDETTGEWSPKAYSGTYGTNGFYLPFNGNANDSSGNGNNWTENNLASTDYMIDTPTNNFSVLNPLSSDDVTLQEGNLEAALLTTDSRSIVSTIPISAGKWYAEVYYISQYNNALMVGVVTDSYSPISGTTRAYTVSSGGGSVAYFLFNGNKRIDDVDSAYGSAATIGDVIGIAFNLDEDEITFYKNNVSQGVITTKAFSGGYNFFVTNGTNNGNQSAAINFGQDSSFAGNKTRQGNTDSNGKGDFYYAPPAGYLALCENNLPTSGVVASGGTETTILDGGRYYKVHTFTSSDTFTVSSGGEVEYLVVAGGGGTTGSGGGGAGGYRSSVVGEPSGGGASAESKLAVTPQSYTITVGAGGAAGTSNGSNSSFGGITSIGGGYGGSPTPSSGGSGGGGGISSVSRGGAAGTSNQGYRGGNNIANGGGGGGGGAGQIGGNGLSNTGGNGGNGIESSIDGTPTYRAGGGAGGSTNMGTVGLGGGSGANTGGGGGDIGPVFTAEAGGSGIVIIRYAV